MNLPLALFSRCVLDTPRNRSSDVSGLALAQSELEKRVKYLFVFGDVMKLFVMCNEAICQQSEPIRDAQTPHSGPHRALWLPDPEIGTGPTPVVGLRRLARYLNARLGDHTDKAIILFPR